MYCSSEIIHITLDSGAEAPLITPEECKRLGIKINPPSQLANGIDKSKLEVIGEIRTIFERGPLKLSFEALVIPKIDGATILAGSPFFVQHEVDICYSTRSVKIGRKYSIPWSPSKFLTSPDKPATVVKIAKTTVLLQDDHYDISIPKTFPSNSTVLVYPHSDKMSDYFHPQQVEAIGHTVRVRNYSSEPIILEKNMHAFGIRAMKDAVKIREHETYENLPKYSPQREDPEIYLQELQVDPHGVLVSEEDGAEAVEKLAKINKKYHEVYNGDLSTGYNGASGPCTADWDFIQEPPVSHSKVPIYAREDQLYKLQLKIDHLYHQGIVRKPQELGLNLKLVNPIMLVKKGSAKDKPWDKINPITETRAVLAANIINEWSEDVPGNIITPEQHLAKVTKFKFHITSDMANSFDQIKIAPGKLPYMGFNSPFKGQYIFTRSGQGRKGSSEKLNELTALCFGHLISEGWLAIIHDDIHVGGNTVKETVENWEMFLKAALKNNLKMNPKKTIFFPKKFDCVGYTIDGQVAIPNAHRINALKNYELPVTVGQLRSYLGLYKTFLRNQKDQSQILDSLHQLTGNNHNTRDRIPWTEDLKLAFYNSQTKVDTIVPLYNPKPEDQLIVTWDWCEKKRAIGAILWAISENEKHVCSYYSLMLDKSVKKKLIACEGEALAAKFAIFAFRTYLIRAKNVNIGLTDNEIFYQAYRLLAKGNLSTSQKLNALAVASESANVQIQHLSGKMGFNFASDQFSRFPTNCNNPDTCEICKFVSDTTKEASDAICISRSTLDDEQSHDNDTPVLDIVPEETSSSIFAVKTFHPEQSQAIAMTDEFILAEQQRDPDIQQTIWYLENRRRPNDRDTSINTVKHYLRYCKDKASKEGYLFVNKKGILMMISNTPGLVSKTSRPVIPEHLAMALIATIHLKRNHPKMNQIQGILKSSFFILKSSSKIQQVLNNCLLCNADEFLQKKMEVYSTSEPPDHPYQKLAADVMKRSGSIIMVVTDTLTSHTSSCLVKTEKAEDLELALIKTILPFRPGNGTSKVRVDTAPGLRKIINNPENLKKYDITLDPGRPKNKNSLSVVDKRIRELEDELRKLSPEGDPVNENTLLLATKFLNEKVRQHGFSANELLFRRKQETHEELNITDKTLKNKVLQARKESHSSHSLQSDPAIAPQINVGQIGFIKHEKTKHSVRPAYFVTKIDPKNNIITAKKMLHVHSRLPSRFQNTNYEIKMSDFVLAKSSIVPHVKKATKSTVEQAKNNEPVKPIFKTSSTHSSTNSQKLTEETDDDDSSSGSEDDDGSEGNFIIYPEANNSVAENEAENLEVGDLNIEHDEGGGSENSDENEDLYPVRPQRTSKTKAYRTKLWLRDNESEVEESEENDEEFDQVDGNYLTPESLTPDTSPFKEQEEVNEDDLVSNKSSSHNLSGITNLEWDNYASSPELSGCHWENSRIESDTTVESPIRTRYFFNKNHPGRLPIAQKRQRHMSASENDLENVEAPNIVAADAVESGCLPTRTFFRRVRQSFGWPSRSAPNLADNQNSKESSL